MARTKATGRKATTPKTPKEKAPAKGTYVTEEMMEEARRGNYYIKLGEKGGQHLVITGAPQKWGKEPEFTYLPAFRVAGYPADLLRILVAAEYPADGENGVRSHIASGYNAATAGKGVENEDFKAELAAAKAAKAGGKGKTTRGNYDHLKSIVFYADNLESAEKETSPKRGRGKSASPKPKAKAAKKSPKAKKGTKSASPKKGVKTDLNARVAALKEGKVLDVTNYKKSDQQAKLMDMPSERSAKILIPGTRLVSSSARAAKSALSDMGIENVDELVAAWKKAVDAHEATKGAKKASPKKSPKAKASPSKRVALPPPPSSKGSRSSVTIGSTSPRSPSK